MDLKRDINKIRNDFYGLDYQGYLNAAATSPPLKKVHEASKEWWRLYISGTRANSPINANIEAAKLINSKKTEICMINRVSEGINIVKDIINWSIGWNKGDNIVFTNLSYPSTGHTFLNLRKKGVEIRQIKNTDGKISLSDWEKAIDKKTKLVVVNRTEWVCGFTHDLEAICKIAHEKGALVLDDDIQALGALILDVKKLNLDFMVTGSYKWQCGKVGAGIFYIREELIDKFEPMYSSYNNIVRPGDCLPVGFKYLSEPDLDNIKSYDYPYVKTAQKFSRGINFQPNSITYWEWAAALKYLNDIGDKYGWESIQNRVCKLGGYLIARLLDIGCKVNTPIDPEQRHGLINYTTGSYELNEKSYYQFYTQRPPIIVSLRYMGGVGGIRVCTHFYNTKEEIDKLIEAQRQLML